MILTTLGVRKPEMKEIKRKGTRKEVTDLILGEKEEAQKRCLSSSHFLRSPLSLVMNGLVAPVSKDVFC